MLFTFALALASLAAALPLDIEERQFRDRTSITENEFSSSGTCGKVIFVFARGSTEAGNMGSIVGQPLGDALRKEYGQDLQIEGVDYGALVSTNFLPGGTDAVSEASMKNDLNAIHQRCPEAVLIAGGYSQGAAVCHRAIEDMDSAVKNQIAAVVTFGDTQFRTDNGAIPNFPAEKLKVFCNPLGRDTVCDGNLAGAVLAPHLSYGRNVPEGAQFLIGKANAVLGK